MHGEGDGHHESKYKVLIIFSWKETHHHHKLHAEVQGDRQLASSQVRAGCSNNTNCTWAQQQLYINLVTASCMLFDSHGRALAIEWEEKHTFRRREAFSRSNHTESD